MSIKRADVDHYITDGCGRCSLGGTPDCKVHTWHNEIVLLRKIVLDCGLIEEIKWGMPCYTFNKSNVAMVAAFKNYCALSFFKGALLNDEFDILQKQGEESQSGRVIKFTNTQEIKEKELYLRQYLYEAIEVERVGLKIEYKKASDYNVPEEFRSKMDEMPKLKSAFNALTPGRQKGYIIHFSSPKQSQTRITRIDKCLLKILSGKGFNE